MKLIKLFISLFNKLYLKLSLGRSVQVSGLFWLVRVKKDTNNFLKINSEEASKSLVNIVGEANELTVHAKTFTNSSISIKGTGNIVRIEEGVELRQVTIILRGTNCTITIGKNTTFGGARLINVGKENHLTIGKECMFSDHIEVWASDTHTIFDLNGNQINKEASVTIGNKVWVGSRAMILKGVTIENGAVIGMGALVTKNVPTHSISVGFPNKVVKSGITWSNSYDY
ncbi:acyltransferase [Croceivirga sp. JEA036]|uniref:acyltransferase n=1 Tax=Croceivirga sp. JEA036 TaxID=2721162 RepID=UPI00143C0C25|nr:acyltransferase [Croceivirga sp. JEA036]NJB35390.1 acyltransferase [Croceivirga sp. JEA036]